MRNITRFSVILSVVIGWGALLTLVISCSGGGIDNESARHAVENLLKQQDVNAALVAWGGLEEDSESPESKRASAKIKWGSAEFDGVFIFGHTANHGWAVIGSEFPGLAYGQMKHGDLYPLKGFPAPKEKEDESPLIGVWHVYEQFYERDVFYHFQKNNLYESWVIKNGCVSREKGNWTLNKNWLNLTMGEVSTGLRVKSRNGSVSVRNAAAKVEKEQLWQRVEPESLHTRLRSIDSTRNVLNTALSSGQIPLFNPTGHKVKWEKGPIIPYPKDFLTCDLLNRINHALDSLLDDIVPFDSFLTSQENFERYDSTVAEWEEGFLAFIKSNDPLVRLLVIDESNQDEFFKSASEKFEELICRKYLNSTDTPCRVASVRVTKFERYYADKELVKVEGFPEFHLSAEEARRLHDMDANSVLVNVYEIQPVLVYYRNHPKIKESGSYHPKARSTQDWAIQMWKFEKSDQADIYGLNHSSTGQDESRVYTVPLVRMNCSSDINVHLKLRKVLRFSIPSEVTVYF